MLRYKRKTIKAKALTAFTRQLATLIEAGFPLLNGLSILSRQSQDPVLKKVILNVAHSIQSGSTFFESLGRHPKIFNQLFVNMVQAGEVGGVLASTVSRLSEFHEKAHKFRNKIIAALAYPLITLLTAVLVLCFLLGIIVPKFQSLLPEIVGDKPLPLLTIFITNTGNLFQQNLLALIAGFLALSIAFGYVSRTQKGKYFLDAGKLKIPLLGNMILQHAIARFSRTLGTLIDNGIPILQALALARETITNARIASVIDEVHLSVQAGSSLGQPLELSKVFPPLVVSMIHVGEETGRLSQMLIKIADFYEDEVESAVTTFSSLIEPLIIIFLAFIVGIILLTLFLPLLSMADGFSTL